MSLEKLVKDLKGQMSGKWKAHIPAPGHSDDDLSVSLLVTPDNRLVIHTFGGTDWQVVRDNLRERGYITPTGHLTGGGVSQDYNSPDPTRIEKLAAAQRIWDAGRAISGTLSERHVRLRRVMRALPGADVLRHVQDCPLAIYDKGTRTRPASGRAPRAASGIRW